MGGGVGVKSMEENAFSRRMLLPTFLWGIPSFSSHPNRDTWYLNDLHKHYHWLCGSCFCGFFLSKCPWKVRFYRHILQPDNLISAVRNNWPILKWASLFRLTDPCLRMKCQIASSRIFLRTQIYPWHNFPLLLIFSSQVMSDSLPPHEL